MDRRAAAGGRPRHPGLTPAGGLPGALRRASASRPAPRPRSSAYPRTSCATGGWSSPTCGRAPEVRAPRRAGRGRRPGRAGLEELALRRAAAAGPPDPLAAERRRPAARRGAGGRHRRRTSGSASASCTGARLDAFGYGPKTLARVLRLQRALDLVRAGTPYAEVADTAGLRRPGAPGPGDAGAGRGTARRLSGCAAGPERWRRTARPRSRPGRGRRRSAGPRTASQGFRCPW